MLPRGSSCVRGTSCHPADALGVTAAGFPKTQGSQRLGRDRTTSRQGLSKCHGCCYEIHTFAGGRYPALASGVHETFVSVSGMHRTVTSQCLRGSRACGPSMYVSPNPVRVARCLVPSCGRSRRDGSVGFVWIAPASFGCAAALLPGGFALPAYIERPFMAFGLWVPPLPTGPPRCPGGVDCLLPLKF